MLIHIALYVLQKNYSNTAAAAAADEIDVCCSV